MRVSQVLVFCLLVTISTCADLNWWKGGNFYQIYPRSFMDSNGDGIGDLQGIKSKVSYLKEIGMDGVWLSPIMKSPQADFGYDIEDYRDIHKEYGTLADFDELAAECNKQGIKLILDLVPNHSSNKHEWFIKSENREAGYENYYIWHPGTFDPFTGKRVPPNNWVSVFRGSGWKWSEKRKQFYYHAFLDAQPDLNYRNRRIVQEIKDVISYWLGRGVQGFRIDAVPYLFETRPDARGNYADEPLRGPEEGNPEDCTISTNYCYTKHVLTQDQPETFEMIYQWRELMDSYAYDHDNVTKVIMTEAYTALDNIIKFYGDGKRVGSHVPFNFELISNVDATSTAKTYFERIANFYDRVPKGMQANWVLGNHDNHRLASRLGPNRRDMINILLQTLPGVAVTYQGEELGLLNTYLSWKDTIDPAACNTNEQEYERYSRDGCRTPFPWDATKNAGFSTATKTWLPVKDDYETMNVDVQRKATYSHLNIFKRLTKLRRHPVLREGEYDTKLANNDNVIIYRRWYGKEDLVVVILNFGTTAETVNVNQEFSMITETTLPLYVASLEVLEAAEVIDTEITLTNVVVPADKGIVLSTVKPSDLEQL